MFGAKVWVGLEILEISSAVGLCVGAKEIALGRFCQLARRVPATLCASRRSVDCCDSAASFVASFRCRIPAVSASRYFFFSVFHSA
jgi:hypothetical protein